LSCGKQVQNGLVCEGSLLWCGINVHTCIVCEGTWCGVVNWNILDWFISVEISGVVKSSYWICLRIDCCGLVNRYILDWCVMVEGFGVVNSYLLV
jgi:hypothetical protein